VDHPELIATWKEKTTMKRVLIYAAMAIVMIGAAVAASAASDKEITLKGEVIDQPCYEGKGAKGEAHKACALSCAKRGNQLAILDDGGAVYSITGDYAANKNEKLIPYVADTVEVKGTVTEKDGKKWLNITSIKKAEAK
jgi:type 1 fimbria pilin